MPFQGIGCIRLRPSRPRVRTNPLNKRVSFVARTARTDFMAAHFALLRRGWTNVLDLWGGDREETMGRCYVRDGRVFWLNHRTVNELPE